jgi:hypothetical protein
VQTSVKLLHAQRIPYLLLKVDLARAFDPVAWPFMIEIMQHMGFPRGWVDWISTLLSSASTCVLLNGSPGERICHARGLRQGDPLSAMLFLLVMEVLNAMIRRADECSLLQQPGVRAIPYRTSMYVDNLFLFSRPREQDLQLLKSIFDIFYGA